MGKVKTDYRSLLIARAAQAQDEPASAISLTEYRARQDIEAWRERYALATAHPPAGQIGGSEAARSGSPQASSSPGSPDRVGRPRLSEFLRRRWPWQFTIGGRA